MENLLNVEKITENEKLLEKRIFTKLQLEILKKKLQKKELNSNEKTYYYKYIKPKLKAILALFDISDINIMGREHMIESRILEAVKILKKMQKKHKNKKIMISGSFLFSKKYNDIDVFVFTKYKKEDYKTGKIEVNFLPESALGSLLFSSISQMSVSNFKFTRKIDFKIDIKEIMTMYETLIIFALQKDDYKQELRNLLLRLKYTSSQVILNPKQLSIAVKNINPQNICEIISQVFINDIGFLSKQEKFVLNDRINSYEELEKEYPNSNKELYLKTYRKAIQNAG